MVNFGYPYNDIVICKDSTDYLVNSHKLNCIYTNIDQLSNKFSELELLIYTDQPDIVLITEVKPKNSRYCPMVGEFVVNGYSMWQTNVESITGRGCIIYHKKNLKVMDLKVTSDFSECIFLEIFCNNHQKLLLGVIYRSPNSSMLNNNKLLDLINEVCRKKYCNIVITGDFNFSSINWDNMSSTVNLEKQFIDCIQDNYLNQLVKKPTRKRGADRATLLDLILSQDETKIENLEICSPIGHSDHAILKYSIIINPATIKREKLIYFYNRGDYEAMCENLKDIEWNNILDHNHPIDTQWSKISNLIKNLKDKYVPNKIITLGTMKKWSVPRTKEMKILGNKRDRQWTRYMETGDNNHYKSFCRYRNKVKHLSRENRKAFENDLAINAKTNNKAIWKYINARLKINKEINEIHTDIDNVESDIIEDMDVIVQKFAQYFSSVFTIDDNVELPKVENLPCIYPFNEFVVTEKMVLYQLKMLDISKSAGPDDINARMLKELAVVISKPLSMLFNNSLKMGTVPSEWKMAYIAPIHKKNDRKMVSNYRPISLTCITCKVMEKIIYQQIIDHIQINE